MARHPTDPVTTCIGGMDGPGNDEPVGLLLSLQDRVRLPTGQVARPLHNGGADGLSLLGAEVPTETTVAVISGMPCHQWVLSPRSAIVRRRNECDPKVLSLIQWQWGEAIAAPLTWPHSFHRDTPPRHLGGFEGIRVCQRLS